MFKWDGLIPDDPEYVERDLIILIGAAMGGILFGLLHSLARNNEFPRGWKICCGTSPY